MKVCPTSILLFSITLALWPRVISPAAAAGTEIAAKGSLSEPTDPGWPREITRNGIRFVYYQPQVDDWKDFHELRARLAFTLTPKGGKPVAGIEELSGRTVPNLETRTVAIDNIEIVAVRFPSLSDSEAEKMSELLRSTFPGKPLTVSLDRLIASAQVGEEKVKPVAVKTDAPPIFTSTEPAVLLTVDAKPVLAPIKGSQLKFVLNTNWDLFFAPSDSHYYLLIKKLWLSADSLDGRWTPTRKLPVEFGNLPSDWDRVKQALPPRAEQGKPPKVFFSAVPAELIIFSGAPSFKSIPGTQLSYATNTKSWIFRDAAQNEIYYLVTGRWFRADSLTGPWSYAGNDLPPDFQQIPTESAAAEVLSSVPGTSEAEDAVLLAQIPTSAVIDRADAESKVKVEYQGEPQFAAIEGTDLRYATNTDATVIQVEDRYYLCANAVWFVAPDPTGPWKTVTEVPPVIYTIPPSSPVYRATYVKVDGSNEKEVTCSYTAGYSGAYVAKAAAAAVLVWGTGYYYPPYVYPAPVPIYHPYYPTYGVAATYYPATGYYATGGYAYGPYNSAGQAAWYNPSTGAYGRAYTTQSSYGGQTSAWGYNPSTGTSWNTQQGHNYYSQWGTSTAQRNGETYQAGHVVTNYGSTAVAKGPDNLYAGHDGNVYKRDDNGNWSKYDNGQWQPVSQPQRNNESRQKQPGTQQNNSLSSQPSSASPNAQSKRQANNTPSQNQGQSREARQTTNGRAKQRSDEPTAGLEREASARQRGSERVNLQQRRAQSGAARNRRFGAERGSRGSRDRFSGRQ